MAFICNDMVRYYVLEYLRRRDGRCLRWKGYGFGDGWEIKSS